MNMANISKGLVKVAGRSSLVLKKYSPEILLVVGVTGAVTSTVMACKATLHVEEVLDNHQAKTDKIADGWAMVETGVISLDEYSEKDHKKDLTVVYVQTAVDFVKLYGPAVTLGIASLACIIGSHGIMRKRNVALVAAYKAVEEGFAAYRKRVVDEFGEDKDYAYRHGLKSEQITTTELDADGKSHKVKTTQMTKEDPNDISMYARFFDESASQWSKDPEYNAFFLKTTQRYYNDLLKTRGHVFLNEVYDALGMERTKAGAAVGWVLGEGDSYIDFGIFDGDNIRKRAFVNGHERSILLDFNVDGLIWDKI